MISLFLRPHEFTVCIVYTHLHLYLSEEFESLNEQEGALIFLSNHGGKDGCLLVQGSSNV